MLECVLLLLLCVCCVVVMPRVDVDSIVDAIITVDDVAVVMCFRCCC